MNSLGNKKIIGIISIILIIIFSVAVFLFIGNPLISFVSEPQKFRDWIEQFGFLGRLIFLAMVIFQVIVAIIPGEPFEMAAGYAFGTLEGTILCILGAVIGSIIIFLLVKRFGIKLVELFFSKEKIDSLKFLKNTKKLTLLCNHYINDSFLVPVSLYHFPEFICISCAMIVCKKCKLSIMSIVYLI